MGGGSGSGGCSDQRQKRFVLDAAREWYLFRDLLPDTVETGQFENAAALLDALTAEARVEGKDRFFSYLTTPQADDSILQDGQFVGFGFRTQIQTDRLWLTDVFENSPASEGGLARGVEITHIDSGSGFVPIATILAADPDLEQAFGPSTEGIERGIRFLQSDGQMLEAVFSKSIVTIQPVPEGGARIVALPANPTVPVGYLNLRTFTTTAATPLRNAYEEFRAQGIEYFIVDLRYNGGGFVNIAELIGDLNARGRSTQDVFLEMHFNERKRSNDSVRRFQPQPESVAPVRIAFITTGLTASASELVINSLEPWVEVAIVGEDTLGKPVGQSGFDMSGCDLRLRLVTFQLTNADGEGEYYEGLASTLPFACRAADDLFRMPGDVAESSTAAALAWLGTGACTEVLTSASRLLKAETGLRVPQARRTTAAQTYLPGLY
jgi:C-terminal processing protease CtpA/Prc